MGEILEIILFVFDLLFCMTFKKKDRDASEKNFYRRIRYTHKKGRDIGKNTKHIKLLINQDTPTYTKSEYYKALCQYKSDLENAKQSNDRKEIIRCLGKIGDILKAAGYLNDAIAYYEESLDIHRDIGDREGEAIDLENIGLVTAEMGDLDGFLEYFTRALKIHRDVGNQQGEAQDLSNMGIITAEMGSENRALEYLKKAIKIHRKIEDHQGEAYDLGNMGIVYREMEDNNTALMYLRQARDVMEVHNLTHGKDSVRKKIKRIKKAEKTA